ncbi:MULTISPECIES: hypothetical protein [unclassified Caballeronia]|uniref:hypothetical protein n=1 Tax=unclassified Caballeronia TaxID=2646786 RepID=UPI002865C062|nr:MULTISPECIES: hypothetical protein [unclassified Caballeronia]MDR5806355.1 hypothetical protein [Caballeronia sp. LZ001]
MPTLLFFILFRSYPYNWRSMDASCNVRACFELFAGSSDGCFLVAIRASLTRSRAADPDMHSTFPALNVI